MILLREIIASFHGPRLIQLIYIKWAVRKDYIKCRFAPFTHLRIANVLAHAPKLPLYYHSLFCAHDFRSQAQ
jgi:hypothetical protein